MKMSVRFVAVGAMEATSFASGCGADADDSMRAAAWASSDGTIGGHVKEWQVALALDEVPAGEVTFEIENQGTVGHEFLVVKTDIDLGRIPVEGDHFSEEQEKIFMVDEIPEYAVGTTERLTVTLEPGVYQLVCNLPGHYAAGMFTNLTVVD